MPRLLFVVNNPDFFVSHRLEIGSAAVAEGYEVHLAAPEGAGMWLIEQHDIRTHRIPVNRSDHSWSSQLRFMLAVRKICRQLRPDICHMITVKTFLVAGFAAKLAAVPFRIGSISGLGFLFISESWKTKLFRAVLRPLFRWVMKGPMTFVIFQNDTDKELMQRFVGLGDENTIMIRGSGVDLSHFSFVQEPEGTPVVTMASRLLIDKGVMEYLEAARAIKRRGHDVRFLLTGDPDPANPASVKAEKLQEYIEEGSVEWIGHCDDIASLFAGSNIVVLPSYREGLPKVLIEAAACGRAVVTTDVPGCRDAIIEGTTGVLVPARESSALSTAIENLCLDSNRRYRMGAAARKHAEQYFSIDAAVKCHLDVYADFSSYLQSRQ